MKKILVFGGAGLVGSKFIELFSHKFQFLAPDISEIDILNRDQVSKTFEQFNPDTVINFAAITNVEEAENQKQSKEGICFRVNAIGAKNIAEVCKSFDKHLIHISTEYVFDGAKAESPYSEEDKPNPINWYGQTKLFGEQFVLESGCFGVIIRICMPFSSFYDLKKDVARFFLDKLKSGSEITAIEDQNITPTSVSDIAHALALVADTKTRGLYHVCSKNSTSPYKFAQLIAQSFNLNASLIKPISFDEYNRGKKAKLLRNSWMDSAKFTQEKGPEILHRIEESILLFKKTVDERE